jgi:hypothetical protein
MISTCHRLCDARKTPAEMAGHLSKNFRGHSLRKIEGEFLSKFALHENDELFVEISGKGTSSNEAWTSL